MEALLQHFKKFGMEDVNFIIVNSKDMGAQIHLPLLQNRVSFPVYQETEQEDIWDLMEGGKDDMYVYDRCGRLTYYIPFPLSIIHDEQPVVLASVLSTYFQSPCGSTCDDTNGTFANALLEEAEETILNPDKSDVLVDVEDDFPTATHTTVLVTGIMFEDTDNDTTHTDSTVSYQIDSNDVIDETTNSTENQNVSSSETKLDAQNETMSIQKFIWRTKVAEDVVTNGSIPEQSELLAENYTSIENLNPNQMHNNDTNSRNVLETKHKYHHNITAEFHTESEKINNKRSNVTADKCLGADDKVCKDWSKRRLLHAQKCCATNVDELHESVEDPKQERSYHTCRNFGKKRCKKIHAVLKCCLKTELSTSEESSKIEEKPIEHRM